MIFETTRDGALKKLDNFIENEIIIKKLVLAQHKRGPDNKGYWISDDNKVDPDILPELPGSHVLVRPISIKEKTIKIAVKVVDIFGNDTMKLVEIKN